MIPTTATPEPSSPACAPAASQESWFTLRSLLISVSETPLWAPRAHVAGPATRPAACWTAVAACAVAVGTTCFGRREWSAVIAVSTGAAMCCVTSARSQSGSTCVSEGQPHSRLGKGRGAFSALCSNFCPRSILAPGNTFGCGVRVRWNLSCVAFSPTVEGPWSVWGGDVTPLLLLKRLDGLR